MDIIGVLPIVSGYDEGACRRSEKAPCESVGYRRRSCRNAFRVIGKGSLNPWNCDFYDFKVGGGIVLLVMAILGLDKGRSAEEHSASTGVVPLGVPLITGPVLLPPLCLQSAFTEI